MLNSKTILLFKKCLGVRDEYISLYGNGKAFSASRWLIEAYFVRVIIVNTLYMLISYENR